MAKSKNITPIQREYAKQVKRIKQFVTRAEKRGYVFSENVLPDKPKKITQGSVNRLAKLTPEKLYSKAEYGGEATQGEIVSGLQGRKAERKYSRQKAQQTRTKEYRKAERHKRAEERKKIRDEKWAKMLLEKEAKKRDLPTQTKPIKTRDRIPTTEEPSSFVPPENVSTDVSFFDRTVISGFKENVSQYNEHASSLLLAWLDKILADNDEHDVAIMLQQGAESGLIVSWQVVYDDLKLHNYMSAMLNYLPEAGPLYKEQIMEAMEEEESFSIPE